MQQQAVGEPFESSLRASLFPWSPSDSHLQMTPYGSYEDVPVEITEEDLSLSPLSDFRPKSRTMSDLSPLHSLDKDLFSLNASPLRPYPAIPRRSPPHQSLQVFIPGVAPTTSRSLSPQSESPETPVSLSSPISGVVDLTKYVKTISTFAVAQGGLSDIYKGEWDQSGRDCDDGSKEVVVVCHPSFNLLPDQLC